ncbi:MAG: hypothetical protein JXA57_01660 [Armatimonadetes bacterium]|nr:hypothetical protein [Armatimonadota bacterium]
MTTYYRARDHDPVSYSMYVQESAHWKVDTGLNEPVETPAMIPDDLMAELEEMSEAEAIAQLSKTSLPRNGVECSGLRPKQRATPEWYALMILGAVVMVLGIVCSDSVTLKSILLVVVGIVATVVGKRFVLRLPAAASEPTPAGPVAEKGTPQTRVSGRLAAWSGHIVGLIVGLVCVVWARAAWDPSSIPWPLVLFPVGLIAAGIGLTVSYSSREWRKANPKRPILRLVVNAVVCSGAIYVALPLLILFAMASSVPAW